MSNIYNELREKALDDYIEKNKEEIEKQIIAEIEKQLPKKIKELVTTAIQARFGLNWQGKPINPDTYLQIDQLLEQAFEDSIEELQSDMKEKIIKKLKKQKVNISVHLD
jgi:type II secretory pathway predicted ATPase ExeA